MPRLRAPVLILSLALAVQAAPLRAEDATPGDPDFGEELFASLCIACHHQDAQGDDRAPDIRGAPIPAIRRGTSGMDSMQDFQFDAQDIADIHAYLATLVE
ncbi:MAG: cytochrome c [Maritimibacter sp.]|nr:cytochrome c [Maritimibacter sp.]